jgi:tetratricopeptide (TPR) repeat protein
MPRRFDNLAHIPRYEEVHMSPRSGLSPLRLAVVLYGLLLPAVPFAAEGKIPLTTKNEEARAAYLKGRDLLEKLRVADARAEFENAARLDPTFAMALFQLANTQPTARGFNETIAQAKAVSANASKGEQMMIDAGVAGGHGDNSEQCRILKELTSAYPKDERAWTTYGNALFGMQDWAGAVKAYEPAIRIAPSYSQPYNQLGYAYRFLGQMDKAEATFKKYTQVIPNDPNPYDSYAELLLKLGRYEESIANYRKALGADPGFIASHVGIATDYDLMHKPKEALAEADQLIAVAKDDGQKRTGIFTRAVSFAHAGDLAGAQKELWREYEVAVAGGDTLNMIADKVTMGTIALEQGDPDAAAKSFDEAAWLVDAAATIPAANRANQKRFQSFLKGRVALARNDVDQARKWSDTFAAEANASGSAGQKFLVHELAGQVAMLQKQYDRAIDELSQASQQDPYNLYRLSLAYQAAGKTAKAKEYAAKAKGDNTLNSLNYAFVLRQVNGGKTSAAE